MPVELSTRPVSIMNCGMYMGVGLLQHAIKIVEKVLEKRFEKIAAINHKHFGLMPGKGTIDAIFILRWMQEEYLVK